MIYRRADRPYTDSAHLRSSTLMRLSSQLLENIETPSLLAFSSRIERQHSFPLTSPSMMWSSLFAGIFAGRDKL
jgi:hypothetical protein